MSRHYCDPVTGDSLSLGERVSWAAQSVIRRWSFLGVMTTATAVVWIKARIWTSGALDQWNLWASFGALVLESVVGIAMFAQTRRDATVLRHIERIVAHIEAMEARDEEHRTGEESEPA